MIERLETVREERTVTVKLGRFEIVVRERGGRWTGGLYLIDKSDALAFCGSASSEHAIVGELLTELGVLHHATGEAIEAAKHWCTDCHRELPLTAPDLCETCAANRNDCAACGAACNPLDENCYACGAALRGAA